MSVLTVSFKTFAQPRFPIWNRISSATLGKTTFYERIVGTLSIMDTYYDALGCSPFSSYDELKSAYRSLALSSHPDKQIADQQEQAKDFTRIDLAWKTLRDPSTRKAYDETLLRMRMQNEQLPPYGVFMLSQIEPRPSDGVFSIPCRCGGTYSFMRNDLPEDDSESLIGCDECSLTIAVVNDSSS